MPILHIINEDYYKKATEGKPQLTAKESQRVKEYLDYNNEKANKKAWERSMATYLKDPMEEEAYAAQFEYIKTGKMI